uniref:Uncharacterized protein n=1 Tax=mine drainage metagenome TaxID=410659 RepID=E6QFX2_9ZZZZ
MNTMLKRQDVCFYFFDKASIAIFKIF